MTNQHGGRPARDETMPRSPTVRTAVGCTLVLAGLAAGAFWKLSRTTLASASQRFGADEVEFRLTLEQGAVYASASGAHGRFTQAMLGVTSKERAEELGVPWIEKPRELPARIEPELFKRRARFVLGPHVMDYEHGTGRIVPVE
jgi:hypothetical protein